MYWIYVLECESNLYYVGETSRLFKRLNDHKKGNGCKNTSMYKPLGLVGLYRVCEMSRFLNYKRMVENYDKSMDRLMVDDLNNFHVGNSTKDDARLCEDFITLEMYNSNFEVRGGKYLKECRLDGIDRVESGYPRCRCGVPCEIRKKYITRSKWKLYYCCSLKNVWDDMRLVMDGLNIGDSCDYYMEYLDDIDLRLKIIEYI
jgi:predicted GIY-YIG superfamily endonuclease